MLTELYQEILTLTEDKAFLRNFGRTIAIVVLVSLSLFEVHQHPGTVARQEKFDRFSEAMSAGAVIKTFRTFPR